MNTKNNTQKIALDRLDFTSISEKIKKLSEVLAQSFELEAMNTLQKQVTDAGSPLLLLQEELQNGKLHRQIKRMARALKKCTENTPTTTEQFTDTVTERLQNFLDVLQEIEEYPIEKIAVLLEQMLQNQNIESYSVKSFLKKFKKALINIMIKHYMSHEQVAFDLLIDEELKNLKVDYVIGNSGLKYLEPHKYKQYLNCLNRGIIALHLDMKAFTDFSNPFLEGAELLFQNIIAKLHQAAGIESQEIIIPTKAIIETESKNYPAHIFRTYEDFQLFNNMIQKHTKAEDIGFIFRKMSELENPRSIVAKETVFRNWFNEESGHKIELNNAIKTMSRIKSIPDKEQKYILNKKLFNTITIKPN